MGMMAKVDFSSCWGNSFWNVLYNKPFWPLLLAYTVATFGVSLNSSLARYYYRYRLEMDEAKVGLLLVSFMIFLTLSLIGRVRISSHYGKLMPLRRGVFLLGFGTCIVYPIFQPGTFWSPIWVAGGLLGLLVGSVVLFDSILTDVIDLHRLQSGGESAGFYFGIWRFASKLSRVSTFFAAGSILSGIGFEPNKEMGSPEVKYNPQASHLSDDDWSRVSLLMGSEPLPI